MRLLRDFQCPSCQKITERFIEHDQGAIQCSCGAISIRTIGMPRVSLEGISGSFPGAADRWAKIREERHRINAKRTQ